ncbi:hypothetical protein GGX14DRAFT_673871 [Mycena pura]|uniref:Uncharacterized protein n=1 Tax=Mycena pura TaxID=153505 RepID=A0AAD6UW69_9AGAR|nr:hypothetical protein GGX14DRAFT_673871 [Mycena pura]
MAYTLLPSLTLPQCPPRERPVLFAPPAHAPGTRSAHRAYARRAVARSPLCSAVYTSPHSLQPSPPPLTGFLPPAARQLYLAAAARASHFLRLAHAHEAAAHLAALTPLPPSPTLSQEARDEALAVSLALGTSPPPSVTTADTCAERSACLTMDFVVHCLTTHSHGSPPRVPPATAPPAASTRSNALPTSAPPAAWTTPPSTASPSTAPPTSVPPASAPPAVRTTSTPPSTVPPTARPERRASTQPKRRTFTSAPSSGAEAHATHRARGPQFLFYVPPEYK